MGYDVDLVGSLLTAMRRSRDELHGISTSAPEGQNAMKNVAGATGILANKWIPFASGLLSCEAMAGYKPATIADGDLANVWLRSLVIQNGWRTSTDPLAPADKPMTPEQAARLATWLSKHGDDLDDTLDDDELILLERQLGKIAASPSLAKAFMAKLTPEGRTDLVNELGNRRADLITEQTYGGGLDEGEKAELATIDAAFEDLGTIVAIDLTDKRYGTVSKLVAEMDPYAASLLVQHLELGAKELAAVAASLIERERSDLGESAMIWQNPPARAADILMETILATPDGPSRFVVEVADSPELLLLSAYDPQLANQILLEGTAPAMLSRDEQAEVIPAFIDFIVEVTARPAVSYSTLYNPDILETTGKLMAAYLVPLFASVENPFNISDAVMWEAENFIYDNPELLQYLLAERIRLTETFAEPLGLDHDDDYEMITEFAWSVGILNHLYVNGKVSAAEREQALWDLQWTFFSLVSLAAPTVATDIAITAATLAIPEILEAAGYGPDDIEKVRLDATADVDTRTATIASIVTGLTFEALKKNNKIPADAPSPPVFDAARHKNGVGYGTALQDWSESNDLDRTAELWVLLAGQTVFGAESTASRGAFQARDKGNDDDD